MNQLAPPVLEVSNLSKTFGGIKAVNNLSLSVERGRILGLIGPNGAGKSVLINLICGIYPQDAGTISIEGERIEHRPDYERARMGIGRTYQNIRLLTRLSVLENVLVAVKKNTISPLRAAFRRDGDDQAHAAMELLRKVNLDKKADYSAGALSYGESRRLEIARALTGEPKVLFLDEPAAGMNEAETDELINTIRFCQNRVQAIVVVEHDMSFMQSLADWMIVMEAGNKIAEGLPPQVLADKRVIEAYLGVPDDQH